MRVVQPGQANGLLAPQGLPAAERCSQGCSDGRKQVALQPCAPRAVSMTRWRSAIKTISTDGAPAPGTGGGVYKAGQESSDRDRTAASNRSQNADGGRHTTILRPAP